MKRTSEVDLERAAADFLALGGWPKRLRLGCGDMSPDILRTNADIVRIHSARTCNPQSLANPQEQTQNGSNMRILPLLLNVPLAAQTLSNVPQSLTVKALSHIYEQIDTGTHCNTSATGDGTTGSSNTNCRNTAIQVVRQVVVSDDGTQYTGQCVARFIWQGCNWLEDGQTFQATIKGRTMEVTAHKGGNLGKLVKMKYKLMDIQPPKP